MTSHNIDFDTSPANSETLKFYLETGQKSPEITVNGTELTTSWHRKLLVNFNNLQNIILILLSTVVVMNIGGN